ncbi:MAG: FecR domain-containing protein [Myxococcota bacterium]|nr:FecR domain-containing protein [Myxococcota bacterium]
MRNMEMHSERWLVGLCLTALLCLPAGLAGAKARVTAAVEATSGDQALDESAGIEDGADLETGDAGGCSLLVDDDALMEVCGNTSLQFARKGGAPDGPRVVKLDRGEIRMVVEPRLGEEKIEIHTPAAIATVLGTILHVAVDAQGITTITSEVSRVLIESSDPSVAGKTTIEGGQQVVVRPGQAPPVRAEKLSQREFASLGGCLLDFHATALHSDRKAATEAEIDATLAEDIADATLPGVAQAIGANYPSQLAGATAEQLPDPAEDPPYPQEQLLAPPRHQEPWREAAPGTDGQGVPGQGYGVTR